MKQPLTNIIFVPYPIQIENEEKPKKIKNKPVPYSEFKSDGKPKPQAADSIRSYDDFVAIQNYLLNNGHKHLRVRNWAIWTIGVSFGIRASDVCILRVCHLIDENGNIRKRLKINEKKTGKFNNILITESVQDALQKYFLSLKSPLGYLGYDDYLFPSEKGNQPLEKQQRWRIFDTAGKKLNLPFNVGAHTMRHSFQSIVASVDKTKIDMNFITKAQFMLNHTDQRTTMAYLKIFDKVSDKARIAVSEFILGRTDVNELIPLTYEDKHSLDDVVKLLEELKTNIGD